MNHESVRVRLAPIIEAGEAATCAVVDLEVLFSARNYEDHREIRRRRELAYERVPVNDDVFDRAVEIQAELARTGRHRIPIPDLLIAAASESADLTVLHYDADFDAIAEVTGQRTEWVVPRGSVP
jgi:predicted nucleic acid-binding protein